MAKNIEAVQVVPSDLSSQLTIIRGTMNTVAGKYRQDKHGEGRDAYKRFMEEARELGRMLKYA